MTSDVYQFSPDVDTGWPSLLYRVTTFSAARPPTAGNVAESCLPVAEYVYSYM
ncbi:hypothetical protein OG520_40510 (plasmid) [Streptomyces sp. NBC_00984]|uniref:hypothetical protein n=1 Tax=Streptomyces sp. NBC_00984 TaxID=2903700 RepID=UPI002F91B0BF|nr:hypothetical protein OG520_40510 [Streptomyces sp. NBC_00984]